MSFSNTATWLGTVEACQSIQCTTPSTLVAASAARIQIAVIIYSITEKISEILQTCSLYFHCTALAQQNRNFSARIRDLAFLIGAGWVSFPQSFHENVKVTGKKWRHFDAVIPECGQHRIFNETVVNIHRQNHSGVSTLTL